MFFFYFIQRIVNTVRQINTDRTAAEEEEMDGGVNTEPLCHPISLNLPSIMATECVSIINSGKNISAGR